MELPPARNNATGLTNNIAPSVRPSVLVVRIPKKRQKPCVIGWASQRTGGGLGHDSLSPLHRGLQPFSPFPVPTQAHGEPVLVERGTPLQVAVASYRRHRGEENLHSFAFDPKGRPSEDERAIPIRTWPIARLHVGVYDVPTPYVGTVRHSATPEPGTSMAAFVRC